MALSVESRKPSRLVGHSLYPACPILIPVPTNPSKKVIRAERSLADYRKTPLNAVAYIGWITYWAQTLGKPATSVDGILRISGWSIGDTGSRAS